MARFRSSVPFDKFHGQILTALSGSGLICASSRTAASTARSYAKPSDPYSSTQENLRTSMAIASASYASLHESIAEEWRNAAMLVDRQDILGLTYRLTGSGLYCMVNVLRLLAGELISSTVPSLDQVPKPTAITSISLDISGAAIHLLVDASNIPDNSLIFARLSKPLPSQARRASKAECRFASNDIPESVAVVNAGQAVFRISTDFTLYSPDDRLGVLLQPTNSTFFPGHFHLFPNVRLLGP